MGKVDLVLVALVAVAAAVLRGVESVNVVLIVVDDLGYNDLHVMGSPDVSSPNIDRLANGGVQFPNAYSMATFCSPARAGLMTGVNPARYGHFFNPSHMIEDTVMGLPLRMKIIPGTLRGVGYKTVMIGKWHLGMAPPFNPLKRGFTDFFGFLGGHFTYWKSIFWNSTYKLLEYIYEKYIVPKSVSYLTVEFTTRAINYISEAHDNNQPFFIYLAYNAPHGPFLYMKRHVDPEVSPERQPHVAMIKTLDVEIGKLVDHLENLGILNDTVIMFTNDNGGHRKGANNWPLRDFKGAWYEGGIRVPLFIYWRGQVQPGQVINDPVTLLDIYPTVQALAQVPAETQNTELEGKNLMPHIAMKGRAGPEDERPPHENICLGMLRDGIVRQGKWKMHIDTRSVDPQVELFDLDEDVGESNNLMETYPDKVQELLDIYAEWNSHNVQVPAFPPLPVTIPIELTLSGPEEITVARHSNVDFTAFATHLGNKFMWYQWEVFRSSLVHSANFTLLRSRAALMTYRNRKRTDVRVQFTKNGTWTVRVNAKDGRFIVFKDFEVIVT